MGVFKITFKEFLQIIIILAALLGFSIRWSAQTQAVQDRLDQISKTQQASYQAIKKALVDDERMQIYLSGKDPDYWQKMGQIPNDPPVRSQQ